MSVSDLTGVYKQAYANGLVDLVPKTSILQNEIPLSQGRERIGDLYHQPVIVRYEQGITFGGATGDAYPLNAAISMKTQDAQVPGYSYVARATMSYDEAAKAITSVNAFIQTTSLKMNNLMNSISKFVEVIALYGQSADGIASSVDTNNINATSTTVVVPAADWASGIWSGGEGVKLDAFDADTNALVNTTQALVVESVSVAGKSFVVSGAAADITALDTAAGSGTGVFFRYFGAYSGSTPQEGSGLKRLITNTGLLYNINASTYNLWAGNSFSVGGNFSFDELGQGLALAQGRGLDSDVDVIVSPITWKFLNDNVVANRRYDESYDKNKADTGAKVLQYYTQSGVARIWSHIYCKEGDAFALPFSVAKRIGAQDPTLNSLGDSGLNFREMGDAAGFEYRVYTNQNMFLDRPAVTTYFSGITNVEVTV